MSLKKERCRERIAISYLDTSGTSRTNFAVRSKGSSRSIAALRSSRQTKSFGQETFARDRRRYLHWLFQAKKRFGLCVLDYMVTCNHIHLLVKDTGPNVIAERPAHRWAHCAGIQPAERQARRILGRSLSCHRCVQADEIYIVAWPTST